MIRKNKVQKQIKHRENDFLWIQIVPEEGQM